MVQPSRRSRTLRRVYRRTPGGRTVLQHKIRKPSKATCGLCGKVLAGVPRTFKSKLLNLPKTKKRPERPFGGVLCSACTRRKLIAKART